MSEINYPQPPGVVKLSAEFLAAMLLRSTPAEIAAAVRLLYADDAGPRVAAALQVALAEVEREIEDEAPGGGGTDG